MATSEKKPTMVIRREVRGYQEFPRVELAWVTRNGHLCAQATLMSSVAGLAMMGEPVHLEPHEVKRAEMILRGDIPAE